jgi:release factor glutamine methyltransferase
LPSSPEEEKTWLERAWAGGPQGRRLIDQFITKAPRYLKKEGKILLVQSNLADIDKTLRMLNERKLEATVIAEKKEPFEKIVVIRASILSRNRT